MVAITIPTSRSVELSEVAADYASGSRNGPVVLESGGKPVAVLLTADAYDQLVGANAELQLRCAILEGQVAATRGELMDHEEVVVRAEQWKSRRG